MLKVTELQLQLEDLLTLIVELPGMPSSGSSPYFFSQPLHVLPSFPHVPLNTTMSLDAASQVDLCIVHGEVFEWRTDTRSDSNR